MTLRKTIFICHASEDKQAAEELALRLRHMRFNVFLDRLSLPPGHAFDDQIQSEIVRRSDAFVFLISPKSIEKGRYTLTELEFAQQRWPHPHGRVLPVMISPTNLQDVPSYLTAVTILETKGNVVAETAARVEKLTSGSIRRAPIFTFLATCGVLIAIGTSIQYFGPSSGQVPSGHGDSKIASPHNSSVPETPEVRPSQFPPNFHLMFTLESTDANPNLLDDIARLYVPARRMERKIIRQRDDFYDEIVDTPSDRTLFSAIVAREIITGYVGIPPRTSFCLRRSERSLGDLNRNHVILRCKEGDQPCDTFDSADEGLLLPAQCTPRRVERNSITLGDLRLAAPRIFSEANAQTPANVWSVPSLASLLERRNTRALRDGFTVFSLRSAEAISVDADGVSLDLVVNDTSVLVSGIPADLQITDFDPVRPLELKFALQNLNFNGRYAGCDQISAQLQFYKQGERAASILLRLRYSALRNVERANVKTDYGLIVWSAHYEVVSGPNEAGTDWRVFVQAAPTREMSRLQNAQKEIDLMGLVYQEAGRPYRVVAVLRPALRNSAGIALGLLQDTGQIRFTFTRDEATRLRSFAMEERRRNGDARRLFVGDPDLYQEPPGADRSFLCPSP
jgi:TIR domain-containing protein